MCFCASHWERRLGGIISISGKIVIIDGYNFIHKIKKYKDLLKNSLESARDGLIRDLEDYGDFSDLELILVFDGIKKISACYKNSSRNIQVVFATKGADLAIERLVYKACDKSRILVVSDDNLIKAIVFGMGSFFISCTDFYRQIKKEKLQFNKSFNNKDIKVLTHKLKF